MGKGPMRRKVGSKAKRRAKKESSEMTIGQMFKRRKKRKKRE